MADKSNIFDYNEESIKSLDWREHIRLRPGMYIGKLGDEKEEEEDGKKKRKEEMNNCIYVFMVDVVSKINTGAKYDSKAFQKSVGLNGVGTKAVNALSNYFKVTAFREGKEKTAEFERGVLIKEHKEAKTTEEQWNTGYFCA